jgi:hypothetical protein
LGAQVSSITAALDALITMQEALSITDPITATIKKAYKLPPQGKIVLDFPCVINNVSFVRQVRSPVGILRHFYTIEQRLLVKDADLNRGAQIALAFWHEILITWNENIKLTNTVYTSELRGASPTIGIVEFAGLSYPACISFLDVQIYEPVTFGI